MIRIDCRDLETHLSSLKGCLFTAILDESPDWIYIKDTDSCFLYSNKAHLKHVGLTSEQLLGKNDLELYPPELAEIFYGDETRLFSSHMPIVKVEPNRDRNGQQMMVLTVKQLIGDLHGKVVGMMGIGRRLAMTDQITLAYQRDHLIETLRHDVGPDVSLSQLHALEKQMDGFLRQG